MTAHSKSQPGRDRHQMKQRSFLPKQRATLLQTLRYALRVKTNEDLPAVFQLPVAVALRPGSRDELAKRFNVSEDRNDQHRMAFESAMALYYRSGQYTHALQSCEQLFSIDMEPAGPPDHHRDRAETGTPSRKEATGSTSGGSATDTKVAKASHRHPQPTSDGSPKKKPKSTKPAPLTPEQKRTFHPDQHADLQARFSRALAVSEDELPAFLTQPLAIPLRIGVAGDLIDRFDLPDDKRTPERRQLNAALSRYCRSRQYQHAILNCETRFSIDMDPDAPITEANREHAIKWLREMNRRRQEREEARKTGTTPPCPS